MSSLSRSTIIRFIFDLVVIVSSTNFWYSYFNLSSQAKVFTVILLAIVGVSTLFLKAHYKIREFNINIKNTYLLFEGVVLAHIIPISCLLYKIPNGNILKFSTLNIITIFACLWVYRVLFHFYLFNFKKVKNILIIGTNKNAKIIATEIKNKKALKMKVVGFLEDTISKENFALDNSDKVFNQPNDLNKLIIENDVDIIIIAVKERMEEKFLTQMIFDIPNYVKIYKMPEFYELVTGKFHIDEMSINSLFYDYMRERSKVYDFIKRVFDIVASSIVLLVTMPILAYIALRVKLTDGGSPIFTQDRVGKKGEIFKVYKLRTMYMNDYKPKDDVDIKYAQSVKGDDRIIPFCRFVRKARLDEIPQMINILKGEMSIVGPRAEWEKEVQIFSKEIPCYDCRMWTRTGWTGWSHINMEPVFTIDEEKERLAYDLYYLKHRNVLWELGILIKAVFLAVGGRHK